MRHVFEGVVGVDYTAANMRAALEEAGRSPLEIEIDSPGGAVWAGFTIGSILKRHPGPTTARVTGLCASIATFIAISADYVIVEPQSAWMVHDPSQLVVGTREDHAKAARLLEKLAQQLAEAYSEKTSMDPAELRRKMNDEWWLHGDEIVKAGFANRLDTDARRARRPQNVAAAVRNAFDNRAASAGYWEVAAEFIDLSGVSAEDREAARLAGMQIPEYLHYLGRDIPLDSAEIDERAAKLAGMSVDELHKFTEATK